MKNSIAVMSGLFAGLLVGAGVMYWTTSTSQAPAKAELQPLYWVAPMDPNYRSDLPGKSPMGMDLIPVFESSGSANAGEVSISPIVENNLGVRTAKVFEGKLQTDIRTVGLVRFDEDRLLHMHPRVEGWVEALHVKAKGDVVSAGQEVYALYSPVLISAQEELLLALERNNPALISSAEERLLSLQVPAQQIALIKSEKRVRRTIAAYAPEDGIVASLGIREGQFIQPGTEVLSLGTLDEVWVIAEVFERQAALVHQGDAVSMSLDYVPGRIWKGQVDYLYPTLDEKTRTLQVRLRFENHDQVLKPNMFSQVTIHSSRDINTLVVPTQAVIRSGTQDRLVLALGEGRYKSVEVQLGRSSDTETEILAGVNAGDVIVTSAHFLLDSESSIDSDFKRMGDENAGVMAQADELVQPAISNPQSPATEVDHSAMVMEASVEAPQGKVTTTAVVERLGGGQMLSLAHEPIEQWNWPAMTMMFEVSDSVDISNITEGQRIEIDLVKTASGQLVTGIRELE